MAYCLTMPACHLGEWTFQLLWNGAAMLEWSSLGLDMEDVDKLRPETTAALLALLGREAAAVRRHYGYDYDTPPTREELQAYLASPALMPWEITETHRAIVEALRMGNHRDYKPAEDSGIDLTTIELKKN